MLEQVVQNLEKDRQSARIKKLVFCTVNGRWSNDAQQMSIQELQQYLQTLLDRHPSIVEFKHALYQIVTRLNHSNDYYAVANSVCAEVEKLYESQPRLAVKPESLPPGSSPAAVIDPAISIVTLRILASHLQQAHVVGTITVNGQQQAEITVALPADLIQAYSDWQAQYRKLDPIPRRDSNGVNNLAPEKINQCQDTTATLLKKFQEWLQGSEWQLLKEQIQRSILRTAAVQVFVTSEMLPLLKLPWNLCIPELLPAHPQAEAVVCLSPLSIDGHPQVSICSVIANGAGIDIEKSQSYLNALPEADSHFLVEAETAAVLRALEQPGTVLLLSSYLSGYSTSERIFVNANDSITGAELRAALHVAVRHGLQLLIWNGGDGLDMAAELAAVGIPHMVVMREPMPDRVANELMKLMLKMMANGQSLPGALRTSRTRLQEVERVFPAVSWLPVLCQPRAAGALHWSDLVQIKPPIGAAQSLSVVNGHGQMPVLPTMSPAVVKPPTPPPVIHIFPAVEYETLSLGLCLTGYYSEVHALAISADGQFIISGHGDIGYKDNNVKVWRLDNGELIHDWAGHTNWVKAIALTADPHHIFSSGADGKIRSWDLGTGRSLPFQIDSPAGINTLVVSPDGQKLLGGTDDGTIKIWNAATGQLLQSLAGHHGSITAIAISCDGQAIATAGEDGIVRVWNIITNQLIHQFSGHSGCINDVAIARDRQQVISAGTDRTIRIWHVSTGELRHTLVGHERPVNCLTLTPDGRSIVSGSDDKTVKIWDLADGSLVNNLVGHDSPILTLAISNDGQMLVSGGYGEIRIWEIS